jgi:malate synthase
MSVATFEAVVQQGQIKLPASVRLPEQTKVYVVVPRMEQPNEVKVMSPRLVHPEQAKDFEKTIIPNANL